VAEPSRGGADKRETDEPTVPLPLGPDGTPMPDVSTIRLFNSPAFFRLWLAQVVSALGDWIGFIAVTAIAARIGGSSPETAISLVLSARLVPGFFLGPIAGVLVDRWDRKRVMVACDIGRGLTLASLPFVDTIAGLFFASLLLEVFTLMWGPAKEASVPNLVQPQFLTTANSLSLVAAYGTFPIGSAVFALLAKVAEWLGGYDALEGLRVSQESVAIYFDVVTFFVSALMISSIPIARRREPSAARRRIDMKQTFRELAEGWRFIGTTGVVRAVIFGLATGLFGGGMVVPLGPIFSSEILGGGTAGFGLLLTALGVGVAVGIIGLSVAHRRLPLLHMFVGALFAGGAALIIAASLSSLAPALAGVALLGLCAGSVYILGYTILQINVEDELRGRIFATLYTLTRFTLLLAFALAPVLSRLLEAVSDDPRFPGVRLTLWFGGVVILASGVVAFRNMGGARSTEEATS
jgi:dTMP kinase